MLCYVILRTHSILILKGLDVSVSYREGSKSKSAEWTTVTPLLQTVLSWKGDADLIITRYFLVITSHWSRNCEMFSWFFFFNSANAVRFLQNWILFYILLYSRWRYFRVCITTPPKGKNKEEEEACERHRTDWQKREYVGRNKINMASGQQWVLVEMVQAFYEVRLAFTALEWNNFLPVFGCSLPELSTVNFEVRKYLWPELCVWQTACTTR